MKDMGLIIITSVRNNLRLKAVTIVFISLTLMLVAGLILSFCLFLF